MEISNIFHCLSNLVTIATITKYHCGYHGNQLLQQHGNVLILIFAGNLHQQNQFHTSWNCGVIRKPHLVAMGTILPYQQNVLLILIVQKNLCHLWAQSTPEEESYSCVCFFIVDFLITQTGAIVHDNGFRSVKHTLGHSYMFYVVSYF